MDNTSSEIMDKKKFFDDIRDTQFNGKLTQSQVNNINVILEACIEEGIASLDQIAYILATAYHEVGPDLKPVREGFALSNAEAVRHVTKLFQKGVIRINYAMPEKNGLSYYGRGYVQLTWPQNYKMMGKLLGVDLYNNPDLALHPDIAAKILVKGMKLGCFTGKKLSDYFYQVSDRVNARRIINGTDKAQLIAGHADKFYQALV